MDLEVEKKLKEPSSMCGRRRKMRQHYRTWGDRSLGVDFEKRTMIKWSMGRAGRLSEKSRKTLKWGRLV